MADNVGADGIVVVEELDELELDATELELELDAIELELDATEPELELATLEELEELELGVLEELELELPALGKALARKVVVSLTACFWKPVTLPTAFVVVGVLPGV